MANWEKPDLLKYVPFQSSVDESFWHGLSSLKLNKLGIDESPIPVTGFFAPCSRPEVPNPLTLLAESFPSESSEQYSAPSSSYGNRNRCPVPGILYNANTLEGFKALDKQSLLKAEAKKIWNDIHSGKAEEDCSVLLRFLVISFADLKKWSFYYWFAFPALVLDPRATVSDLKPAVECLSSEEGKSLTEACSAWRDISSTTGVPFFIVSIAQNSNVTIRNLSDWDGCQHEGHMVMFGFYDPCNCSTSPGWPLLNYLAYIYKRWGLEAIQFFCYRETHGFANLKLSLIGKARLEVPEGLKDPEMVPASLGWEMNKGKAVPRCISLARTMDPTKLAISAADLNLKLMRWRALPSLDLNALSAAKCLLLGSGTLGCQVARMLMAWGVRKITLLDSGKVAMSNPLRQSLYTLDDCLNGGEFKAVAAVRSLKRIFPAVEADGIVMAIPMPGHPVPTQEESTVLEDCRRLHNLIQSHDIIFLLTDTRESRWLPTLISSSENKITVAAALGFDSFVVMRHGAGPLTKIGDSQTEVLINEMENISLTKRNQEQRLGCYFCNDVVAPVDSTANRTLDQQCTVTRPGLAPIASALAVELLVGLLHHPLNIFAPAEFVSSTDYQRTEQQPLGILPHQIRGSLSQFSQMTLVGHASPTCTACSITVVSEYKRRGLDFLLEAINHPTYLEDLSGLTELQKSAVSFEVDWDVQNDEDDLC